MAGEQLALWKLHCKLGLQRHIDDKMCFTQIAEQKVQVTSGKDMYQLEQSKRDHQKRIYNQMELVHDTADAHELHWEANKYKEPRRFFHWFSQVHHPQPAPCPPASASLSTKPKGFLPYYTILTQ